MKLVYLSPVKWESVAQRPHFFVKSALKAGFESVLWVEPVPSRLPKWRDITSRLVSVEANSIKMPCNIKVLPVNLVPLEPLGVINRIVNSRAISRLIAEISIYLDDDTVLVIGKPSQVAQIIIDKLIFSKTVFDVMDDFPEFYEGISYKHMQKIHRSIVGCVDVCLFSSEKLRKKYESNAKKIQLILNACDSSFINNLKNEPSHEHPGYRTFGYVGSIARWFDWEVVLKLARRFSEDRFIIVGPIYSERIPKLPSNVKIMPAIEHCDVPRLIKTFDYGLIPFVINTLTDSVDPVKYYEYNAADIPVISTNFGEMRRRIELGVVHDFESFPCKIKEKEAVTDWDKRFEKLWDIIL